jgi:uncharacterized phage protein (TIGR01671 family)
VSNLAKSRVWDVENAKMLSWDEIWYSVVKVPTEMVGGGVPWVPFLTVAMLAPDTKYVVERFTGLIDKAGTDIYEGDIVKASVIVNRIDPEKGVFLVRWNAYLGNWALDWRGKDQDALVTNSEANGLKNPYHDWDTDFAKLNGSKAPKLTVVGNIRQHPDLLKP